MEKEYWTGLLGIIGFIVMSGISFDGEGLKVIVMNLICQAFAGVLLFNSIIHTSLWLIKRTSETEQSGNENEGREGAST